MDSAMMIQEAKSIARHLRLTLRKVRSGDYRVNFRDGNEMTAYYTDDLEDAVSAAVEMARKRALRAGPPGSDEQMDGAPIFNKHDHLCCSLVVILDTLKTGETHFYIARPKQLEKLLLPLARDFAKRPKRDGTTRSVAFRKELPRELLEQWRGAWHLFGEPVS